MRPVTCLAAVAFLACAGAAAAGEVVEVDDRTPSRELGGLVEILADPDGTWTIDHVTKPPLVGEFAPSTQAVPNFGFTTTPYWYRVTLADRSLPAGAERGWLLEIAYPLLDLVDVYVPRADGGTDVLHIGREHPFSQRPVDHRNLVVPISLRQAPSTVYLRVATESSHEVPLALWSPTAFAAKTGYEQYALGLYYGALIIMIFYNAFVLLSLRDPTYLYYTFAISAYSMLTLSLDGLGAQFFWGDWPRWSKLSTPMMIAITDITMLVFSKSFLKTRTHDRAFDRVLDGVFALSLGHIVLTLTAPYLVSIVFSTGVAFVMGTSVFVGAARAYAKGVHSARFFLLGWGTFFVGVILKILQVYGLVPVNALTQYSLQGGLAFQVAFLSLALGDRLNLERKQKIEAQSDALAARETAIANLGQYQQIFENVLEGLFEANQEGKILRANSALGRMLGYASPAELLDSVADLRAELFVDPDELRRVTDDLRTKGAVQGFEVRMYRKDRSIFWAALTVRAVRADGHIRGIDGMVADISERKRSEELAKEREKAEAATLAKTEFLARMSHEIRTPMNAIIGFTDLALRNASPERRVECLEQIRTASRTLLEIINDILDISKIEAGKLRLESYDFPLQPMLDKVAGMLTHPAAEKGIELIVATSTNVPPFLRGDALRLEQLLINLTHNAVKFTERGEVEIRVHLERAEAESAVLRFTVRDTGVGLTREQIARLFQSFTQVDESTTRRYGGTGLGLSICKQLVEMMGGEIGVESEPGKGSVFSFTVKLGLGAPASPRANARIPAALRGMKVLVVDDNEAAREVCQRILESFGMIAVTVADGAAALDVIREGGFAVALVDWQMPGMDGVETVRRMRAIAKEPIPVIMMTAYGREELARVAGDDLRITILAKPVRPSALFDALLEVFDFGGAQPRRTEAMSRAATDVASLRGAHVLLVEDNAQNQRLATEILGDAGVTVDIARDGREAVEAVDERRYDAVLMDIQMPVMDGLDATAAIRRNPAHARLPIIALTANALERDRENCFAVGMNDVVTKPIDTDVLYASLARWIRRDADAAPPGTGAGDGAALAPSEPGDVPGIAVGEGLRRLAGKRELFYGLVRDFPREHAASATEMRAALARNDASAARHLAHLLKGVAANLALPDVARAAAAVEDAIGDGRDLSAELAALEAALATATRSIESLCVAAAAEPPRDSTREPVEPAALRRELAELAELVRRNDFAAEAKLAALRHELDRAALGRNVERLERQLHEFDFSAARLTLSEIVDHLG